MKKARINPLRQNTNHAMVQAHNKRAAQQEHIAQVLQQLTVDYQMARAERKLISEQDSDEEFSLLEELELLTVDICGYASQVKRSGRVSQNDEQAIAHLQNLRMFDRPVVAQFYAQAQFPRIRSYIRLLDYLRLLVLEYLQMQQGF
jgi:hypothetical protein